MGWVSYGRIVGRVCEEERPHDTRSQSTRLCWLLSQAGMAAMATAWAPHHALSTSLRRASLRGAGNGECSCSSCYVAADGPGRTWRSRGRQVWRAASQPEEEAGGGGRWYVNITGFPFPLGPFLTRRTIRKEVERGRVWTFEQQQALGFTSVSTNTRMTVIKLQSGELWVHAPIAPTAECVRLVKELGAPVGFIVLPTFAYEHKIFVGPFSRKFPQAEVWVAPRLWSWPLDLPLEFLGIFGARELQEGDPEMPWAGELEFKVLSSPVGIGPYVEVAFFHRRSQTLLVTDAVILVPKEPPEVVSRKSLLDAAKNNLAVRLLSQGREIPDEPLVDNARTRQRGWERMVLQILFLGPANLLEPRGTFSQISKRLIVSPIVKTLVFDKAPDAVRDWVDAIVEDWKFKRIIPAHFAAPITANGNDLLAAFAFLDDLVTHRPEKEEPFWLQILNLFRRVRVVFPEADMRTLSTLDEFLVSAGVVRETATTSRKATRD